MVIYDADLARQTISNIEACVSKNVPTEGAYTAIVELVQEEIMALAQAIGHNHK